MTSSLTTKLGRPAFGTSRSVETRSAAEKLWFAGGAVAAFLLLLIGYFMLIGPQQDTTASVRSQVSDAQNQHQALQSRIQRLRSELPNLGRYEAQLAAARAALPAGTGASDLLRELQSAGAATGTTLSGISIGPPTAMVAAAPTTGTGSGTGASASPSAAAAPTATGVQSMTISLQASGSAAGLDRFLAQLQQVQPRALLVTTVNESAMPGTSGGTTLALSMLAFTMPATGAP